jgi:hypothetical protein
MIPAARTTFALLFATALAAPAFAASGDAGGGPTMGAAKTNDAGSGPTNGAATAAPSGAPAAGTNAQGASAGGMHIAQKVRDDLSKAGFTDIHVMPSSFLVRAKDSSGNPVMMVINPDSVTTITEEPGTNAASGSNRPGGNTQTTAPGAPKTP